MYAYLAEDVVLPAGAMVGITPLDGGGETATIRVEMKVRTSCLEIIMYHKRNDQADIGR